MGFPFKTNYKSGDPVAKIESSDLNAMGEIFNGIVIVDKNDNPAGQVLRTADGRNWRLMIDGGNKYPIAFGIKGIDEQGRVEVNGGYVIHGMNYYTVADTSVSVSGGNINSPVYCVLRYTYNSQAQILTIASASFPAPTTTTWDMPLWSAYRENGETIIRRVLWEGIVILPSVWA